MEAEQTDGNIKEKVHQLAETNEKLLQKNAELLEALRSRDQQIKNLEQENTEMKKTIADLSSKHKEPEEVMPTEKLNSLVEAVMNKVSESIFGGQ